MTDQKHKPERGRCKNKKIFFKKDKKEEKSSVGQKVKDDPQRGETAGNSSGTAERSPGRGSRGGRCGMCALLARLTLGETSARTSVKKPRGGRGREQITRWLSQLAGPQKQIWIAPAASFLRFVSLCLCAFFLSSAFEQAEQNKHDLWENVQSPAPLLQTKHYQEGARTKAFVQVALPFSPFLLLGGYCFLQIRGRRETVKISTCLSDPQSHHRYTFDTRWWFVRI